nr:hypothetical protein [Tanacetum cinerariifolium]
MDQNDKSEESAPYSMASNGWNHFYGDGLIIGNMACDKEMINKCTCDFRIRTHMFARRAYMFLEECT